MQNFTFFNFHENGYEHSVHIAQEGEGFGILDVGYSFDNMNCAKRHSSLLI